jgi:hypothetical protein
MPDPLVSEKIGDVHVPLGKPTTKGNEKHHSLMYNEFIVYDVS